jgi:predicted DCC family thiol-disulfide oxidoreductase YuxK
VESGGCNMTAPLDFNIDFDNAESNAIARVFPNSRINRDPFHFLQAIQRWARKAGLLESLTNLTEHLSSMLWARSMKEWQEARDMMYERYSQNPYGPLLHDGS